LTSFSHRSDTPAQEVDLNERINHSLKISSQVISNRNVVTTFDPELPPISGVPDQLTQVFTNIISNAAQATDADAGEIKIRTQLVDGFIEATFSDNGCGIDEKSLKHIVEPFFTTKDVGEGTGLGLSIADRIVEFHKGNLVVESLVDTGTKVTVKFPISNSQNEEAA